MIIRRMAVFLVAGAAMAAPTTSWAGISTHFYSGDATFNALDFEKVFGSQALIGNNALNGEHELKIVGPTTPPVFDQKQYQYVSGRAYNFKVELAGDVVTYTFTDTTTDVATTMTHTLATTAKFSDLFVRVREEDEANQVQFDNVTLTVGSESESVTSLAPSSGGSSGAEYVRFDAGSSLRDGFTFTGNLTMTFSGSPPTGARLMGEIKVGTVVPEPSTVAMAITALVPIGVAAMRRIRRRNADRA